MHSGARVIDPDDPDAVEARRHLLALAHAPRPAGGEAEARARAYCASTLAAAGFDIREAPFEYSAAVGRWGMPAAGLLWAIVLVAAYRAGVADRPALALALTVGVVALLLVVAPVAAAEGVVRMPVQRRRAVNLVATRGSDTPALWLVAHVDSKSQPVPMMARVVGVAGSAVAWMLAVVLAASQLLGAQVSGLWLPLTVAGVVVALPVIGSVIGERSPGALDNASGVAAVLLAATGRLRDTPSPPSTLGVLITSAEELGLAGARAWARGAEGRRVVERVGPRPIALNVDSVDDVGALRVMSASALPAALDAAVGAEHDVVRGHLPAGVLVDALALAAEGFAALTISRGTLRTLTRIHTPNDTVDHLDGTGVADAARLVCRLASSVSTAQSAAGAAVAHA